MLAIIQARLSSRRLPRKMLMPLAGQPLLARVVARVKQAPSVSQVIVATSDAPDDAAIARYCQEHQIACMRGPLDHVAERFRRCAHQAQAPAFVRICGDSPLIDPDLVQQAIELYQQHEVDLVSNIVTRRFPKGQSVEVVRTESFNAVCEVLRDAEDREHVTRYYYAFKEQFRIMPFTCPESMGHIQLSVDTLADLQRLEAIIAACGGPLPGWREAVRLMSVVEPRI